MKKAIGAVVVIFILAILGYGGWYLFLKKNPEGGACTTDAKCQTGLKCINKICSSGEVGSVCESKDDCKTGYCVNNKCTEGKSGDICTAKTDCQTGFCVNGKCTEGKSGDSCSAKTDCKTGFCVNNKCTEGKLGDACATYKDCNTGLLCIKGTCSQKPNYSKYFEKVVISKMKPGMPPGPNNPTTPTTTFNAATDAIEIDFIGVKSTTVGPYYFELVNSTTGEVARSTKNEMETKFNGRDTGMGTDLGNVEPGEYDLNIYYNNELVYSTQITVK